jgi:uncharacterized protein (DUF983 family)
MSDYIKSIAERDRIIDMQAQTILELRTENERLRRTPTECPKCKEVSLFPADVPPMWECENCGAEVQL